MENNSQATKSTSGVRLDKRDMLVLRSLDSDGRLPAAGIARQAGVSKQSVLRRLHALEKQGALKRVYAFIEQSKLGKTEYRVFVKLEGASERHLRQLSDFCSLHPAVQGFASCGGLFQLVLSVCCASVAELDEFLSELERKFGRTIGEKRLAAVTSKTIFGNSFAYSTIGKGEEQRVFSQQDVPLRGRVSYWDLVPTVDDFEQLARIMEELRLRGAELDLGQLVDDNFALKAYEKLGNSARENEWR